MTELPLAGLKILDLSRVLAGPLCTMMLGDLGADVLKVERPGKGDETRRWGPPFDDRGESAYYLSCNRNKISVAADLRSKVDREMVQSLAAASDVIVDNFRPGTVEGLRLGFDELLRGHPGLIWCSITGFGRQSRRPGYDYVVQAEAGWMAITGEPQGEPMKTGVALADVVTGKDAAVAILATLTALARGRRPDRRIVLSLADSARAALVNVAQNVLVSGVDGARWGNAHPNLVPYQLFFAQDRPIVIAVGSDDQWKVCARVLNLPALERDPQLATNRGRVARRNEIVQAISDALRRRPAAAWLNELGAAGVPCGIVRTVLEAIADAGGASPLTGMPSPVGGTLRFAPPRLDEHGSLVRQQGWDAFRYANSTHSS